MEDLTPSDAVKHEEEAVRVNREGALGANTVRR